MWRKIKNLYHQLEAIFANIRYSNPSKKLKVIGITGTDGKTTTTSLIYHILKLSGKKVSMISTVYAKVGEKEYDTGLHTTTPHSHEVQRLINEAVLAGDEYLALETTSHALDQFRVYGVTFEVGLITNITHEHLDYHKTYDNYLKAKYTLLKYSKIPILNRDDDSYDVLKKMLQSTGKKYYTYSLHNKSDFQIDLEDKLKVKLANFNKYNYLAAYTIAWLLGIDEKHILLALKSFALPVGRLESVYEDKFKVIVDFAHTPNSIHEALSFIKSNMNKKGKLIHVFGAAGLRDFTKRPLMGEESGTFADIVILTEEDYRTEDPSVIAMEVAEGLNKAGFKIHDLGNKNNIKSKTYTILINREEAIKKAISIAEKDDVVVITGKGHEKSLARGNKEYPWSDQEAVRKILDVR